MNITTAHCSRRLRLDIRRRRLAKTNLLALPQTQTKRGSGSEETLLTATAGSTAPLARALTRLCVFHFPIDAGGHGSTDVATAGLAGSAAADIDQAIRDLVGEMMRGECVMNRSRGWGVALLELRW